MGELMMTAFTRSSSALSSAFISGCILRSAGGTMTISAPAFSINTLYSGKNGASTTTLSPGLHSAFMVMVSEAAAPQVM